MRERCLVRFYSGTFPVSAGNPVNTTAVGPRKFGRSNGVVGINKFVHSKEMSGLSICSEDKKVVVITKGSH